MIIARLFLLCPTVCLFAQGDLSSLFSDSLLKPEVKLVYASFKTTRIVSARSNETVKKHELDFNVSHRFGDAAGENGGVRTFFGTDNASDIRIALEYGITDRLTAGFSRTKGATAIRELYELSLKGKVLQQTTDNHFPFSLTLFGNTVISSMISNSSPSVPDYFPYFKDRMSFVFQPIFVRKFSKNLTLALIPSYVHYNSVTNQDQNDHFALGVGGRIKFSKRMSFIVDYFYVAKDPDVREYFLKNGLSFYNPLAVGIEMETGGHIFQITFMNSTAILENQFIPYTTTSWKKGQFRWGFIISRTFSLAKKPTKI